MTRSTIVLCICSVCLVPAVVVSQEVAAINGVSPGTAGQRSTAADAGSKPVDRQPNVTSELSIHQGKIRGLVVGDQRDVEVFRGIPFATPPVGDLRWRPPQPPANWEGVRDCFEFGPSSPQPVDPLMNLLPIGSVGQTNEDCLYLNVYRPAKPSHDKLPVMVWIHGGGYTSGSATQALYDGGNLARKGVILVTINYRLGALGFMAHPALSDESPHGTSGNYGILDQIEALRWVQQNIAAFGGDRDRVTIFGESAGGGSVICLLVAAEAKGLFHRAVAQSAPVMRLRHLRQDFPGRESAERFGRRITEQCGLGEDADAAELRSLSAEQLISLRAMSLTGGKTELMEKALLLPIAPIVDGNLIREDPNSALAAGRFNRVPLMVGNTRDEAEIFLMLARDVPKNHEQFRSQASAEFGDMAASILAAYPPGDDRKQTRVAAVDLMTDIVFGAEARQVAHHHAMLGHSTYKYLFSREIRALVISAAFHGCEIPYLFGMQPILVQDWDKQLADLTANYWVNFATHGDPNGAGLPEWPKYTNDSRHTLELGDQISVLENYRGDQLDLIDAFLETR